MLKSGNRRKYASVLCKCTLWQMCVYRNPRVVVLNWILHTAEMDRVPIHTIAVRLAGCVSKPSVLPTQTNCDRRSHPAVMLKHAVCVLCSIGCETQPPSRHSSALETYRCEMLRKLIAKRTKYWRRGCTCVLWLCKYQNKLKHRLVDVFYMFTEKNACFRLSHKLSKHGQEIY